SILKWASTAAFLITIACVWRFIYLAAPTDQRLLISSGASLLLLAAIGFVWRKRAEVLVHTVESQFTSGLFDPLSGPIFKKGGGWNMAPLKAEHSTDI